jgi:hypothetical protein
VETFTSNSVQNDGVSIGILPRSRISEMSLIVRLTVKLGQRVKVRSFDERWERVRYGVTA